MNRERHRWLGVVVFAATTLLTGAGTAIAAEITSADGVWTIIDAGELELRRVEGAKPWVRPERFAAVQVAPAALDALLAGAPMEFTAEARSAPVVLTLPTPDGRFERFAVVESPTMAPELETWMAQQGWSMKTYSGTSLDTPATNVRLDWGGPAGFHAMVHSPGGNDWFIDPYWQGDRSLYVSYYRRDLRPTEAARCGVTEQLDPAVLKRVMAVTPRTTSGNLRTYRLANAATGEYTVFHGGTVAAGLAAITTSINRVNQVYERDFSLRMTLVANNNLIVYTNGATDPYTNSSCGAMLGENQANVDAVIGTANYDIGHVFSTGGGGIATLQSPCIAGIKARGCTGTPTPIGDPFDIDFVAHEMGHQWGGSHTWNGSNGNCTPGQWSSTSAYEPGSGSTIQAYAGICGVDDLQPNSDDHFHRRSIDQMMAYINGGGSCSVNTAGVNPNEPTAAAGADFTIPTSTPFELTGAGTDGDGDTLTYNWEQFDLGTQSPLATGDDGVQPIFRSWPSQTGPTRVFPRLQDLLAGTTSPGETLPVTNRTMNFQLTVRDNRAGGGREQNDAMQLTSTTSSGPFAVTFPNGGESICNAQTVTWNVAGTTGAPVSAANVDIFLSTDGGNTYPITLATATPNDGSETVSWSCNLGTTLRVKVKGSGNVFFDVSNADFTSPVPVQLERFSIE